MGDEDILLHHEGSTTDFASPSQLNFTELAAQMTQFLKIQNQN